MSRGTSLEHWSYKCWPMWWCSAKTPVKFIIGGMRAWNLTLGGVCIFMYVCSFKNLLSHMAKGKNCHLNTIWFKVRYLFCRCIIQLSYNVKLLSAKKALPLVIV